MRNRLKKSLSAATLAIVLLLTLPGAGRALAQKVDLNGNGMSDIWELKFGASGLDPNVDTDGDGVINILEAIAGTDPFDPNSVPRIAGTTYSNANFSVTLPSALGKLYLLQSADPPTNSGPLNWTNETSTIPRTGTVVTLTVPAASSTKYFRISISDVDTDGDGVNDWEEYQLGLDPMNPTSNGHLDGNGQPLGDYAYVTGKLASQNSITISATDPTATQPDSGQSATGLGAFTVSRGGFPLNSIVVSLGLAGPGPGVAVEGVDYATLPRPLSVSFPAGVSSQIISVTPLANTNLMAPVLATMTLLSGPGYTIGSASNAGVLIYPSPTGRGTGLTGQYYTNSSTNYSSSANFNGTNLFTNRVDAAVDFTWYTNLTPNLSNGNYTVRWTGQVQPQYSETYTFDTRTDDGVKLWVDDQLIIDKWQGQGATDWTGSIALLGGAHYDIKMEYFNHGGSAQAHLNWYSPSQSKQIIPTASLYPAGSGPAPTSIVSPLTAVGFVGQPFTFTVVGANSATFYTASGLPPGLTINPASGVISGTNLLSGDFQIALTASNAVSVAASVLDLQVFDTGSSVTREVWTGVAGTNVADIPAGTPAALTNTLGTLEGVTDYGDNYGERISGYLTAPTTGNYYFWIAGSDSAELWISNDGEPVNKVRRAYVSPTPNPAPPPGNGTASRQWNLQPSQQSPWLALVAGQRYYIEILHKAGTGTNDNWAVGWLQDPTGTNTTPGGVVPGYVLSRYYALPPTFVPGTLYSANMLAQAGVASQAVGSATLRLSSDGSQAVLKFSYSGLTSTKTGEHIHCDPYLSHPSQIMFDIDTNTPQPDGSYIWNIGPVGTLSAADVVEIIRESKSYINIHTTNYPAGEINGHFTLADGSQTFTPPPAPPSLTDDHTDPNAAARFLIQATFGPGSNDIAAVQSLGYAGWIDNQISLPPTYHYPVVLANKSADPVVPFPSDLTFNAWWQQSVTAPDQLRQRVAFALSEIMVVSQNGVLQNNAAALSSYYDTLVKIAFGNFRALLRSVTLHPAMGLYLDMRGNDKGDITLGTHANENYAREIQQLFSIGLNRMWPDGTLVLDSQDNLVPTYDQDVISGFAKVFTGWNYYQLNQANGRLPSNWFPGSDYIDPMVLVPTHHDLGTKLLLDNVVLPAAQGSQADPNSTNFDSYCSQDLEIAINSIFNNQNTGPFVCRQLIQRLVTSNPSREYLYRVVQVFNDNGSGQRGDMKAVIKAILLDYEARSSSMITVPTYGKQREPLLRVTAPARAFPSPPTVSGTYSQGISRTITVNTSSPHRLNNNDVIQLVFTDTSSNAPPTSEAYGVTVLSTTSFTVSDPDVTPGTYSQINNAITVTSGGHGLSTGNSVYLMFTSSGASNGIYTVTSVPDGSTFMVTAPDFANRSGNCLFPRFTSGGYTQSGGTSITVSVAGSHGLKVGDGVYIHFTSGSATSGQYQVTGVPDITHFTINSAVATNQNQNSLTVYPLVSLPANRFGNASVQFSTWNMGFTDTGSSSALTQTPLNAPTVFNFFFPNYQFPGTLASAGLTTPEFQLTSDSTVALQMNFLEGGMLNSTGNLAGLTSFKGGGGAITLDLGPWMTTNYVSDAGIPGMVDGLNTLLLGGQLSTNARSAIVGYVANTNNFPLNPSPTAVQMRDRVRAAVHLIISSPDFTIQK